MENRKKYLIVTAAGKGSRMGGNLPKQFLELNGEPVLKRTLNLFFRAFPDICVLTVLAPEMKDYWKELCYQHNFYRSQKLVDGGLTRFHSIKNALAYVPDDALVAVHDGVRPLFSVEWVQELFALAEGKAGVIPCLPVCETLCCLQSEGEGLWRSAASAVSTAPAVSTTPAVLPPREKIFSIQTPQIFDARLLKAAYNLPYDLSFTDDSSVVEKYLALHPEENLCLYYAKGEKNNIKLTTPEDMLLAKAILSLISE